MVDARVPVKPGRLETWGRAARVLGSARSLWLFGFSVLAGCSPSTAPGVTGGGSNDAGSAGHNDFGGSSGSNSSGSSGANDSGSTSGGTEGAEGGADAGPGGRHAGGGRGGSGGSAGSLGGHNALGGAASGGSLGGSGGELNANGGNSGETGSAGAGVAGASAGSTSAPGLCPPGVTRTITVAKSGGDFTSVRDALDSIPSGSSEHLRIAIKPGTYKEKLEIANRSNLCLTGENADTTILTYDDSNSKVGSTSGSASVLVSANDFSASNLTFENSFGSGSQAVALRATGRRQQFLNCRFVGYQDTLYVHQGTQYFKDCYVQGNTDYVFGGATAVLENCELRNVEGGSAVAAPNTDAALEYGIVFLGGTFTAVSSVRSGSVGLGRPWGQNGAAAYLRATLGAHIIAAGFVPMSGNDPARARFGEYESRGAGAQTAQRPSYQLSASEADRFTLENIFGDWRPSFSEP